MMDGIEKLDSIIVGRVDPFIYAFKTNTVPDYLKVGDTYRPVKVRLDEWRQIFPNLQHREDWRWVAKTKGNKYFRDFAVHYYLEEKKQLHRLQPNDIPGLPYYSREFFQNAKPEDIDAAIHDIESRANQVGGPYHFYTEDRLPAIEHYKRDQYYPLRPNQEETVKKFNDARKNGRHNLLMYAVMRFGKSFTSMWCATEMEAKTVLIVSAKADVKTEWKRTVESHVHFEDYIFLDSQELLNEPNAISNLLQQNKRAAIFLTLQDLMGDELKDKHKDLFKNPIDLLIVDETHFGARAEEYGKVLREAQLSEKQIQKELSQGDETFEDLEGGLDVIKQLKVDTTIHLSGTPYRILMGSEFKPEDIIAFYQFTDIIDDKEKWDREHLKDEDKKEYEEWKNPYYGFPQMVRFAFNPNESSRRMLEKLKELGKTASLSELFRPESISLDPSSKRGHLHFVHEKEVLDLLQIIDGSKEEENLLGFLDYQKIKDGSMCHHIVCVLPFCASCDAFENLLKKNRAKFKNLSQYEVVNISGIAENHFKTPEQIKQRITEIENQGKKSITLTVNRMLTGSTVKEWDTMLFLKDVSSPQEYDQAIYRIQNQYIKTYENDNGDEIKYNMKPQTLLVDFDPNRMFVMQEQKSKIYNVNSGQRGNDELEERIRKELKISPIIVINKGKITEVVPTDIMDAVRNYSSSRTVMDEARDIPTDYNLLQDPKIQSLIENLEPINAQKGINIKPAEGKGDDLEFDDEDDATSSNEGKNSPNSGSPQTQTEEKDDADKRLATYFAQILFFALLTDNRVKSLKNIIDCIKKDNNNLRIAQNIGLNISSISYLYKRMNPFILQEVDYRINIINEIVRDSSLNPLERVERALKKFGRFSNSEVVTPSNIADEVIALLPEDNISESTRFLDLASKQAEFACAIYRRYGDKIRKNIFSLPTSRLTYEFTRKVYSLLEFPVENIIESFNTYDLIGDNKEKYTKIIKDMKFDAVVGNPPYHEHDGGAGESSKALYNEFITILNLIKVPFYSLIIPSRWMAGGKQLDDFRKMMLTDKRIRELHDYMHPEDVFPDTNNRGGICVFSRDESYDNTKNLVKVVTHYSREDIYSTKRPLKIPEFDIFIRNSKGLTILNKVYAIEKDNSIAPYVSSAKAFGFRTFFIKDRKFRTTSSECAIPIKCYGRGNRIGFVEKKEVLSNRAWIDRWKVYVPESNNIGTELNDDNQNAFVGNPRTVCTESFLVIGAELDLNKKKSANLCSYLKTKFARFMLTFAKNSQHGTSKTYRFVPLQDFSRSWTDAELYAKYKLTDEEIAFIESMIKPMN